MSSYIVHVYLTLLFFSCTQLSLCNNLLTPYSRAHLCLYCAMPLVCFGVGGAQMTAYVCACTTADSLCQIGNTIATRALHYLWKYCALA